MISDPQFDFRTEDRKLKPGRLVKVFWSQGGFSYQGQGEIFRLSRQTVTVRLQKKSRPDSLAPAVRFVTVPRIVDAENWCSQNCVRLIAKIPLAGVA